jgi:hypothetical protein
MSAPKNPLIRGLLAAGTLGLSEVPAQFGAIASAVQGKDPLKSYTKGKSPMEALAPDIPSAPLMPNLASPTDSLSMSPASSIRNRRNFSTLLTSPTNLGTAPVEKKTLLGGSPTTLGK